MSEGTEEKALVPKDPQEEALEKLSERELGAYKYFCAGQQPIIAESTASGFYELFAQGHTCEDIRKTSPGFGLGQIVHARIHYTWDKLLQEHQERLLHNIQIRVQQVGLEAIDHIADLIAAEHKLNRAKLHKFLVTGDESLMEGVRLSKHYKDALELLLKVTGQDVQRIKKDVSINHTGSMAAVVAGDVTDIMALAVAKKKAKAK